MNLTKNDKESLEYDLSIVKEASEDLVYLKEISGLFITNAGEMLRNLDKAMSVSDWVTVQNIAHKLSSNFYLFGLKEGGKALLKIEINLLKKENYNELPDLFVIAKTQGEKAIMQLEKDFHDHN